MKVIIELEKYTEGSNRKGLAELSTSTINKIVALTQSWKCCSCRSENYNDKWKCSWCGHARCNSCKQLEG